ncbi:MAG: ribosome maturation factor RimM [Christensenellales bacterium]|jgi:16S rRNA processing protein RimM
MLSEYLVIGEVLKPQGVRGEIKVRPITCDPARFLDLRGVYLLENGSYVYKKVKSARLSQDAAYLSLEGVKDRDEAEKLRDMLLYVDRAHAVELPEDADFICDLIGCIAHDDEGNLVGELTEVLQPGSSDVYVFRGAKGEYLVPALKSVVLSTNVREKKVLLSAKRMREVAVFNAD